MTEVQTYFKGPKRKKRRRGFNSTLPVSSGRRTKAQRRETKVTPEMRAQVFQRANGACQADGLHHPDCPGKLPVGDWVPHHVLPREHGGPDTLGNLIAVWCPMGLGLNGCHGRLHTRQEEAIRLGLLKKR